MFSEAKTKQDGLAALGFNSNEKGGAWQGKAALSKWEQSQIVSLCDDFILQNIGSKTEIFKHVAKICNTTYGHVKNLYYADKKRL
ncbi:hypothetical protein BPUTEOMOX_635 [methanotrophic endosymbiont of Bathymodiolus puteoserpentis (Logatchev)]|nr:hypothetical protein BPUTEOMOX_635 [methanotrophic endosymbiont of Bathymodiolus puteoserpentis (Logatchev)]